MKILITGGLGFAGSAITKYLLKKGYKISVLDKLMFNNNHLKDNKFSEVIIYNFETQSFSTKFNNQLIRNNFKTESSGLVDFLPDGSMMVEERNYGRILFFDKDGNLEWEYTNKDDKKNTYRLSWSRFIKDHDLIQNIKHKINNPTCLN